MTVAPRIHGHIASSLLAGFGEYRHRARCRPDRAGVRFRLEGLEDRCLLSITEFPLPATGGTGPAGIAAGPDGNLWFGMATTAATSG